MKLDNFPQNRSRWVYYVLIQQIENHFNATYVWNSGVELLIINTVVVKANSGWWTSQDTPQVILCDSIRPSMN